MANEATAVQPESTLLRAGYVYALAAICLAAGLGIGYMFRGMQSAPAVPVATARSPHGPMSGHMPSMEELKQMADKQAAPLLDKLKSDPNNTALLLQVGAIYHTTHQFQQAANYYGRAAQTDPKNPAIRTKLAASLYRGGDPDAALKQLNDALSFAPTDANTLFNIGMVKLEGKQDAKGAIAAWKTLLKTNPQLTPERKAEVQKLLEQAAGSAQAHGEQGARSNEQR